jgi:transposase-like protein
MADTTTMTERSSGVRGAGAVTEWTPPRGRKRWQLEDGKAMVAALHASEKTMAGFARRHGVQEVRVQRWVARVGKKPHATATGQPVVFAPVQVTTRQARSAEAAIRRHDPSVDPAARIARRRQVVATGRRRVAIPARALRGRVRAPPRPQRACR